MMISPERTLVVVDLLDGIDFPPDGVPTTCSRYTPLFSLELGLLLLLLAPFSLVKFKKERPAGFVGHPSFFFNILFFFLYRSLCERERENLILYFLY